MTFQVLGVTLAVGGMIQNPEHIMKYVRLGDFFVAVVFTEVLHRPVGDIVSPFCAVLIIEIEGEALTLTATHVEAGYCIRDEGRKRYLGFNRTTDDFVLPLDGSGGQDLREPVGVFVEGAFEVIETLGKGTV